MNTQPRKHAELIKKWADGAVIQVYDSGSKKWEDVRNNTPIWSEVVNYRVKPEVTSSYTDEELYRVYDQAWHSVRADEVPHRFKSALRKAVDAALKHYIKEEKRK